MRKQTSEISPLNLCRYDPVATSLLRISNQKLIIIFLIALFTYGVLLFGIGTIVSNYYLPRKESFVTILDPKEVPVIIFTGCFVIPLIWGYYIWQLTSIPKMFAKFIKNNLIKSRETKKYNLFLQNTVDKIFNKLFYTILTTLFITIVAYFWIQGIGEGSSDPFGHGVGLKWWYVNRYYFYLIWLPLGLINYYMIGLIVVRQLCFSICIAKLYKEIHVELILFHPDRCNGLEFIGDFTIKISGLIIFFAFIVLFFIAYPQLFGQKANFDVVMTLSLIFYTILLPTLPAMSIWSTHVLMVKTRNEILEKNANKLHKLLSSCNDASISNAEFSQIDFLEKRFSLLEREYKTWPFRPLITAQYIFTAITPLVGTGISYLMDILLKRI